MVNNRPLQPFLRAAGWIYLVLLLLTVPAKWVLSWAIAVATHEFGHVLTVFLCGGKIENIELCPSGLIIQASQMTYGRQMLSILAGPLSGFLFLFFFREIPRIALCSAVQSVYNLLPIYPLDGGRLLYLVLNRSFSQNQICKIFHILSWVIYGLVWVVALYGTCFLKLGMLPLLMTLLLGIKIRKTSCKDIASAVQ